MGGAYVKWEEFASKNGGSHKNCEGLTEMGGAFAKWEQLVKTGGVG